MPDECPENVRLPEGECRNLLNKTQGFCFFLVPADKVLSEVFQRPADDRDMEIDEIGHVVAVGPGQLVCP